MKERQLSEQSWGSPEWAATRNMQIKHLLSLIKPLWLKHIAAMSHWDAEWSFAGTAYSALLPPVRQKVSIHCWDANFLVCFTLQCCAFSHKLPISAASAKEATLVGKGRQAVFCEHCLLFCVEDIQTSVLSIFWCDCSLLVTDKVLIAPKSNAEKSQRDRNVRAASKRSTNWLKFQLAYFSNNWICKSIM